MRGFQLLLLALLCCAVAGCNQKDEAAGTSKPTPGQATAKSIAIVFGSTENDPWTSALLNQLAIELDIEPLKSSSPRTGFDAFGPYEAKLADRPVRVNLALCDLAGTVDVTAQQQVGELVANWVNEIKPAAVWLDGDQLQLQAGRHIDAAIPIVFSGVTTRTDLYYEAERPVCGVMKQHSLKRIVDDLLAASPASKTIALISDDSPRGLGTLADVRTLEGTLPEGMSFAPQSKVTSWAELEKLLDSLGGKADAVLVCAMGSPGSAIAASGKAPPADLLRSVKPPVLSLGPTAIDSLGLTSYRIKPSVQAHEALKLLGAVIDGNPPLLLGSVVPEQMEVFQSEPPQ